MDSQFLHVFFVLYFLNILLLAQGEFEQSLVFFGMPINCPIPKHCLLPASVSVTQN